jgi:hypothetical protein
MERAKREMLRITVLLVVAVSITVHSVAGRAFVADRTHEIGIQAYIYAYPMILMEMTRRVSTNVEAPRGPAAPMNQLAHLRAFPDHTFREVVRPNADTLYSIVWFDVSKEPMVLSVCDTGGRYYMLPMLDMWTDVIATPGSRTSGTKAASFAIVGPKWQGDLPDGVEPIRSPTRIGWIIGRTQTNGAADYENVHQIQDGYKLTPLSQWGKSYMPPAKVPVNATWDMKTPPPVQVAKMNAEAYFELFAKLLKDNPPHEADWNMVEQLKQIGIIPGEDFDLSRLSAEEQKALERAVGDAQKIIAEKQTGEVVNGWQIAREMMGNYGTSYSQRALIALIGLGANVPEDAVYPLSKVDSEGRPITEAVVMCCTSTKANYHQSVGSGRFPCMTSRCTSWITRLDAMPSGIVTSSNLTKTVPWISTSNMHLRARTKNQTGFLRQRVISTWSYAPTGLCLKSSREVGIHRPSSR